MSHHGVSSLHDLPCDTCGSPRHGTGAHAPLEAAYSRHHGVETSVRQVSTGGTRLGASLRFEAWEGDAELTGPADPSTIAIIEIHGVDHARRELLLSRFLSGRLAL